MARGNGIVSRRALYDVIPRRRDGKLQITAEFMLCAGED